MSEIIAENSQVKAHREEQELKQAIRQDVEKRWKARSELVAHIAMYIIIIGSMWIIWFALRGRFAWPALPTVIWGIVVLSHGMNYHNRHGGGAQNRAIQLEREVERTYTKIKQRQG